MLLAGALTACGTTSYFGGSDDGASTGAASFMRRSSDPLARPTQVAWTSARATRCGFVFDPAQLRSRYLATEQSSGQNPRQMQKIKEAYDYTLQSVSEEARKDANYCTRERIDEVKADLNRYLAGDFRTSPQ